MLANEHKHLQIALEGVRRMRRPYSVLNSLSLPTRRPTVLIVETNTLMEKLRQLIGQLSLKPVFPQLAGKFYAKMNSADNGRAELYSEQSWALAVVLN